MFNSREYEWADISVVMGGRPITGIRGIKYNIKKEKELLYAKGNRPHAVQSGNYDYSGEITLLQSEYLALREAAKGDILAAQLDVVVAYGNPTRGDAITPTYWWAWSSQKTTPNGNKGTSSKKKPSPSSSSTRNRRKTN